jgi:hypothetical protein
LLTPSPPMRTAVAPAVLAIALWPEVSLNSEFFIWGQHPTFFIEFWLQIALYMNWPQPMSIREPVLVRFTWPSVHVALPCTCIMPCPLRCKSFSFLACHSVKIHPRAPLARNTIEKPHQTMILQLREYLQSRTR